MSAQPAVDCRVTVIIPSYRSALTLERCLAGVTSQQADFGYRIVVMHSGEEAVAAGIPARFPEVEFRTFPDRLLPAIKRNWAAAAADTPLLAFLDSDCVPDPSWLQRLVEAGIGNDTGAVGGGVEIARPWALRSWIMHLLEFGEWLPARPSGPCRDFPSCNSLYPRTVFLQAGGFPETFLPCEDTILNAQLKKAGSQLTFAPEAVVAHIHCRTTRQILRHNYNFGLSYGLAAREYDLRGRWLSGSVLFVPLVMAGRFARMAQRVVRYRPKWELALLVAGLPLIMACLLCWSIGFVRAPRATAVPASR